MHQNINNFLEDFKKNLLKEEDFKDSLILFLEQETKITFKKEDIFFVNGVIKISCDNYIKTEIYLIKEKILSFLKNRFPDKNIKDIL